MSNTCPYCGSADIETTCYIDSTRWHYASCADCGQEGPCRDTPEAAIDAFCHPAHLHTYDPATEVVMPRPLIASVADQLKSCGQCGCEDAENRGGGSGGGDTE